MNLQNCTKRKVPKVGTFRGIYRARGTYRAWQLKLVGLTMQDSGKFKSIEIEGKARLILFG